MGNLILNIKMKFSFVLILATVMLLVQSTEVPQEETELGYHTCVRGFAKIFKYGDRNHSGKLTWKEFKYGVKHILYKKYHHSNAKRIWRKNARAYYRGFRRNA